MTEESTTTFEYDVALSFAGEDRSYVHDIAQRLHGHGVQVFYDEFMVADTWGADLIEVFDEVFRRKARFTVAFISSHYVAKPWPTHERRSALARAMTELDPYFLPVRIDGTELPGLRPTVGYVDARFTSATELTELILHKLGRSTKTPKIEPAPGVPRTPAQQERLLATRPTGWEYLYFAGVLVQGKGSLEPKWRDHQLQYVHATGTALDNEQAITFARKAFNEIQGFTSNVDRIFSPQLKESAFGAIGQSGDPASIEYLGQRLLTIYENLLDWSARIRGASTSAELRPLFRLAASFVDEPITQFRDFIDHYVATCDLLPERLANADDDNPITGTFVLSLTIDDRKARELQREMKRLRRRRLLT